MARLSATSLGLIALTVGCAGVAYTAFVQPPEPANSVAAPPAPSWESGKSVAFFDEWLQLAALVSQNKHQQTAVNISPAANVSPAAEPVQKSRRELRREARRQEREKERELRNAFSRERQRGVVFVCIDERCRTKRVVRAPTDDDRDTMSRSYAPEESPERRIFAPFQR